MATIFSRLNTSELDYLRQLISLYGDVFDMQDFEVPGFNYVQSLLNSENIIFYVALQNNKVIGGLTAYILPSVYDVSNEVYIYDLAVQTSMQRKGVGTELMNSFKSFCLSNDYKFIFVQADIIDSHAIEFYKSTGGNKQEVVHFSYKL